MKGGLSEMDCKYVLVSETYSDDTEPHVGYGIAVVDRKRVTILAALDLSPDKIKVADLVRKCNRLKISPIHFQDVVEDFLN